jgi:hypothetical protein
LSENNNIYTRKEIEVMVDKLVKSEGLKHISDMLEEIQDFLLNNKPTSNFCKQCAIGNWDYAIGVADKMNKEILTKTTLFQDFVRVVGRQSKVNKILENE